MIKKYTKVFYINILVISFFIFIVEILAGKWLRSSPVVNIPHALSNVKIK